MKFVKKLLLSIVVLSISLSNLWICSIALAQDAEVIKSPYIYPLDTITQWDTTSRTAWLWDEIDDKTGSDLFNMQVVKLIKYAIDIFIVIGVVVAFFGGYKIMTTDKEEAMKDWIKLVIFWILWIIIMVSARFLANSLVGDSGIIPDLENWQQNSVWIAFSSQLYEKIMFPFIKVALYLVVWVLFFMMAAKIITFIISTDEAAKKKAGGIIARTVIWILIIMWAKQVVEAVMWKQDDVLNMAATDIKDQWNQILQFGSIPIVAQIVNWVMWLTMFAVLVLIIIQAYRMFAKPDDPKNRETLKKTIIYIIIGVLVIGASYAISTVFVVNKL